MSHNDTREAAEKMPIAFVDNHDEAERRHGAARNHDLDRLQPESGRWQNMYGVVFTRELARAAWESGFDTAAILAGAAGKQTPDLCGIIARIVDDPDYGAGDLAAMTAYGITSGIRTMPKAKQRLYLNTIADILIHAAGEIME